MQFASDYDSSSKNIVSGVLRVDATQWDRGQFECQVSDKSTFYRVLKFRKIFAPINFKLKINFQSFL